MSKDSVNRAVQLAKFTWNERLERRSLSNDPVRVLQGPCSLYGAN